MSDMAISAAVNTPAVTKGTTAGSEVKGSGDFLSLISQLNTPQTAEGFEEILANLAAMGEDEDNTEAMELLALLFVQLQNTMNIPLVNLENPEAESGIMALGQNNTELLAALKEALAKFQKDEVLVEQPEGVEFEILETEVKTASTPAPQSMEQNYKFMQAVKEAQKGFEANKSGKEEPIDIEALQAQVNANKFLPAEKVDFKELQSISQQNVVEQLKENILENVAKNKSDFTIKLKPEGLGEIVVNMKEKDGKILLSLTATNSDTAKIIGRTVEALQSSLKPLQAEVVEIKTVEESMAASTMNFTTQKQFDDRGSKQQNGQGTQGLHFGAAPVAAAETEEVVLKDESELNAYI